MFVYKKKKIVGLLAIFVVVFTFSVKFCWLNDFFGVQRFTYVSEKEDVERFKLTATAENSSEKRVFENSEGSQEKIAILVWKYGALLENRHIHRFQPTKRFSPWEDCPTKSPCNLIYSQNLSTKADAVLFHLHKMTKTDAVEISDFSRKNRNPDQIWVFLTDESPLHTILYPEYNNLFNFSMTYRSDSDVWVPYGRTLRKSNHSSSLSSSILHKIRNKTKFAVVMGSNCSPEEISGSSRWRFVELLLKIFDEKSKWKNDVEKRINFMKTNFYLFKQIDDKNDTKYYEEMNEKIDEKMNDKNNEKLDKKINTKIDDKINEKNDEKMNEDYYEKINEQYYEKMNGKNNKKLDKKINAQNDEKINKKIEDKINGNMNNEYYEKIHEHYYETMMKKNDGKINERNDEKIDGKINEKNDEKMNGKIEKMEFKLEILGKCLNGNETACPGHFTKDCPLLSDYKFYLAFENSNCREYITEKVFWNAYSKVSVPVIMGAPKEDCEKLLPPNSFIHVEDFETVGQLTDYLEFLGENEEEYLKFHDWRRDFVVVNEHGYFGSRSRHYCRLCEALNDRKFGGKEFRMVYGNLEEFWNENDCDF